MDPEFELEWHKSKDKELTRLFWNKIQCFVLQYTVFFPARQALITWLELSRVKLYRNDLKGNKNYFEFAEGSSYRGFELPRVRVSKCNSKCKKEIQGKSTSVRVSARFELARVRVFESQLYMFGYRKYYGCPTALLSFADRTMGERSRQTQYHWHDSHWFKQGFWLFITQSYLGETKSLAGLSEHALSLPSLLKGISLVMLSLPGKKCQEGSYRALF